MLSLEKPIAVPQHVDAPDSLVLESGHVTGELVMIGLFLTVVIGGLLLVDWLLTTDSQAK